VYPGRLRSALAPDHDPEILYEALNAGVKGFETIFQALADGPMTDEKIMGLLVDEFDEAEMTTPGPAARHREWLEVLGFVRRVDGVSHMTSAGAALVETAAPEVVSIDDGETPTWLKAVRRELRRYRARGGDRVVTLDELYRFLRHVLKPTSQPTTT